MFYKKIKQLCEQRELSINKLEQECGFGKGTIRKWDKSVPTVEKLMKVADYFDLTLDQLVRK